MNDNVSVSFDGACRLHDWGVIRAQGSDATRFLHGQLSNDFEKLGGQQARLAAYCSAQGRMLASFVGMQHTSEDLWLACSADVLTGVLKRLSMFVLRTKARLSDAAGDVVVLGAAGATALDSLGATLPPLPWQKCGTGATEIVRLPDAAGHARALWLGPPETAQALLGKVAVLPDAHWRWLEVTSGVARVNAATSGRFVPQMLNYEVVGGVDFKKGCYPGQEIVARSQYLGKLKRRAYLLHATQDMTEGTDVFWSGDAMQPAGVVALAAPHPQAGCDAIVELKSAVLSEGTLHLASRQGPVLAVQPLPYVLPPDLAPARPT